MMNKGKLGLVGLAAVAFHHATNGGGSPYYLASALYAWGFLFPDDPSAVPHRFNPRARLASELYNRGLTQGLKQNGTLALRSGAGEARPEKDHPERSRRGPHRRFRYIRAHSAGSGRAGEGPQVARARRRRDHARARENPRLECPSRDAPL